MINPGVSIHEQDTGCLYVCLHPVADKSTAPPADPDWVIGKQADFFPQCFHFRDAIQTEECAPFARGKNNEVVPDSERGPERDKPEERRWIREDRSLLAGRSGRLCDGVNRRQAVPELWEEVSESVFMFEAGCLSGAVEASAGAWGGIF